jgi:hypothetical protein
VRLAVSIGGDSDTLAAIAGSIAGARYGIPDWERRSAEYYLDERLLSILGEFEDKYADEVVSTEMGSVPRISLDIGDGDFALTDVKFIRYDLGYKKIHRKYVIEANLEHKEERCDVYGSGVHDFREAVPGLASAMKHIRVPAFLPLRRDRHTVRKVCDALYSAMDMLGLHNANEDANNRAGGQG